MILEGLKFRRKIIEMKFEDITDANNTFAEYIEKRTRLYERLRKANRTVQASLVSQKFQSFSQDKSFQQAFDLSRNRADTRVCEQKLKGAARQISNLGTLLKPTTMVSQQMPSTLFAAGV